jgi:hypothetical protein
MVRKLVIAAGLACVLAWSGPASAGSKCNAGVDKAAGKKASCHCSVLSKVQAKGGSPDFSKCDSKFTTACGKAQGAADCTGHFGTACATQETNIDTAVSSICSPSGAFLN